MGDINFCRIVYFVVDIGGNWESGNIMFIMVEYSGDIGWEYILVGIVVFYCRVGLLQEMVWCGVIIEDFVSDFNQCVVRIECKFGYNL